MPVDKGRRPAVAITGHELWCSIVEVGGWNGR